MIEQSTNPFTLVNISETLLPYMGKEWTLFLESHIEAQRVHDMRAFLSLLDEEDEGEAYLIRKLEEYMHDLGIKA